MSMRTQPENLSPADLDSAIAELNLGRAEPRWSLRDAKLCADLRFGGFAEAFGFMASVAIVAERMGHHPEWSNVYDRVSVALTTHDTGGVSNLDVELARAIDGLAG